MDREKVIAGLTMLADRKNDDTCEGLKCCKIAEDALALLKEQQEIVRCKNCIWFHKPDAETKKSCKCNYHGCVTEENKYCWWGEKDG